VTPTPPSRPLRFVVVLLAAAFLGVAAFATARAPETYPVADTATTSIYTLRAARGELAVGSYSRFGWNHPGPLLYQLFAPAYEASGRREIALKWTALAINLVVLGTTLAAVRVRSPRLALALAIALTPLLWREQRLLFTAWNPFVPVLALAGVMVLAADLASGLDRWRRPFGLVGPVVLVSLCVQAHVGLAVPCAIAVLAAGAGGAWTFRRDRSAGDTARLGTAVAIAAAAGLALWAVPLLHEVRSSPGNLASMVRFLLDGSLPRGTWDRALDGAAYMTLGPLLPSWVVLYDEVPAHQPAWLTGAFGLLIGLVAVATWRNLRIGRRMESALGAVTLATLLAVVVAARGIVGPMSDYLLLWATAVGALAIAVVLATIADMAALGSPGPAAERGLLAACVVAWAFIGGERLVAKHAEQARDTTIRALATDLQAFCRDRRITHPVLGVAPGDAWQELVGLVLQFEKADLPIAVEEPARYLLGQASMPTGREDAAFYLMPTTGASMPPDAGQTDWVTTRGAYRIVRLRAGMSP
jgi:hypothetical protein